MKARKIPAVLLCIILLGLMTACNRITIKNVTTYNIGICQLVEHQALDEATQGFKDALVEKLGDRVYFDEEFAGGDAAACTTIVNTLVSKNVDLILANATSPLMAAAAATESIPILGTSITDYSIALGIENWTGSTGQNISGTSDLVPAGAQARLVEELFPTAETIGILYCENEANSRYQVELMVEELEKLGFKTQCFPFEGTGDLFDAAGNAAEASDVIYIPTDNTAASATEIIDAVCRPAGVPIIAGEEGLCSGCGVATLSISYYELGYKTGEMAYEILVNGADISTMEIAYTDESTLTKKYNTEIAESLGIDIPDDYEPID